MKEKGKDTAWIERMKYLGMGNIRDEKEKDRKNRRKKQRLNMKKKKIVNGRNIREGIK